MSSLWVSQLSFMVRNTWYTRLTRREFALAHRLEGFRPEASDPVTLGPMTKQRITIVREVGKSQAVRLRATGRRGTNCQRLEGLLASPFSWIYTTSQSVKHLLFGPLGGHSGPNYISLKQSKQNIKCVGLSHTHLGTTWWYYKAFLHPLRQIHREFTMINCIHFMVKKKKGCTVMKRATFPSQRKVEHCLGGLAQSIASYQLAIKPRKIMLVPLGINAGDVCHLHLLKLPLNNAKGGGAPHQFMALI